MWKGLVQFFKPRQWIPHLVAVCLAFVTGSLSTAGGGHTCTICRVLGRGGPGLPREAAAFGRVLIVECSSVESPIRVLSSPCGAMVASKGLPQSNSKRPRRAPLSGAAAASEIKRFYSAHVPCLQFSRRRRSRRGRRRRCHHAIIVSVVVIVVVVVVIVGVVAVAAAAVAAYRRPSRAI